MTDQKTDASTDVQAIAERFASEINRECFKLRERLIRSQAERRSRLGRKSADVTAWIEGSEITKIAVEAFAEHAHIWYEFRWKDSRLVAVRERQLSYGTKNFGGRIDGPARDAITQDDLLRFDHGRLLQWSERGKSRSTTDADAVEHADEACAWADAFRRLMATPDPGTGKPCDWRCDGDSVLGCKLFVCQPPTYR